MLNSRKKPANGKPTQEIQPNFSNQPYPNFNGQSMPNYPMHPYMQQYGHQQFNPNMMPPYWHPQLYNYPPMMMQHPNYSQFYSTPPPPNYGQSSYQPPKIENRFEYDVYNGLSMHA